MQLYESRNKYKKRSGRNQSKSIGENRQMKWEKLFVPHILARGYDYFCDDVVENIEVSGDFICASYNIRIGVQGWMS